MLKLKDAAHRLEHEQVALTVERFHHSDEVARRGDRGPDAVPERFVVRAEAEVLVATGAGGLGDDPDLAGVASQFDHGLPLRVEVAHVERLSVDALRIQTLKRQAEPAQALLREGAMSRPCVSSSEPTSLSQGRPSPRPLVSAMNHRAPYRCHAYSSMSQGGSTRLKRASG